MDINSKAEVTMQQFTLLGDLDVTIIQHQPGTVITYLILNTAIKELHLLKLHTFAGEPSIISIILVVKVSLSTI